MNDRSAVKYPSKDFFVIKPAPVTFAARLRYLRWLRVLETHVFENHRQFADFAGVNYGLYMKWQDSDSPPDTRATASAFLGGGLRALGASEGWLLDGKDTEVPRPELWELWKERGAMKVEVTKLLAKPRKKNKAAES
jgi:hypothetical protein